ncbi:MAG: formyltransferase family protein [Lachnospiraceae bacterium]
MRNVLIGSVNSSRIVLEELITCGCAPELVFSLDEGYAQNVSGYYPLHKMAIEHYISYEIFNKISDPCHLEKIKAVQPDYIFVVGLSQLIGTSILEVAKKGVIGLHPAPLPKFRGRAALVWQMLLGVRQSAVSLFFIDANMDSGPVLGQEPFFIGENDYASDVETNCLLALRTVCHRVITQMKEDRLVPVPQNDADATYLMKRIPEDGLIDWNQSIYQIQLLIRAVSHPYPGAFSHYDGIHPVSFWQADILENIQYYGIPGQIVHVTDTYFDVFCIDGLLHVTEYSALRDGRFIVGHKFRNKGEII